MRVKNGDECTALLTFVDDVEHIASIAAKTVEPSSDQFIALPEEFDHRRKLGTAYSAGT